MRMVINNLCITFNTPPLAGDPLSVTSVSSAFLPRAPNTRQGRSCCRRFNPPASKLLVFCQGHGLDHWLQLTRLVHLHNDVTAAD